jgi:hypothetical protein
MGLTVLRTFASPFGRGFRVTDKTQRPRRITVNRRVALPFVVLILLHVAGLAFAFFTGKHIDHPEIFPIIAFFTVANLALLWLCLLVSMDVRRPRALPRFQHRLELELAWGEAVVRGESSCVSENEVTVSCPPALAHLPETAQLSLPALDLTNLPVKLRHDTDGQLSLSSCNFH